MEYLRPVHAAAEPVKQRAQTDGPHCGNDIGSDALDYEIPPFLRKPERTPLEAAQYRLDAIDARMVWLAERGLCPHANVIQERKQLVGMLTLSPLARLHSVFDMV